MIGQYRRLRLSPIPSSSWLLGGPSDGTSLDDRKKGRIDAT
jgi:hypothetical protein